ncbi:glycosyl hydrolase family 16 [Flavobacterium franklandianum]|uniref:Glycosyl hydrolase family 16 n=1 Tax=Flavobacterium franklandianum TaxID=2594430 RepID=A0A553CMK7_9FLAO|nr:glycosyl hydrolase family 16 [Flavobacterium franklandianum]TRX25250.1 glycosyl hydrolase family 16 [Flavobacterium franklandianum]
MKSKKIAFILISLLLVFGCQNDDADLQTAKASSIAEIFTDTPIGMGTNFYFPYGAGPDNPIGSKLNAWTVDSKVSYKGNASMRFDVPNSNDVEGNYAGGIFRIDGAGRDLTNYDALTFWAKASQGVTVAEFGFGEDFFPNKYITTMRNVSIGTTWTKFIIPIPDASKLVLEKGMFRYAANTNDTNGKGYTFWIDELKFEKLGTIAQGQASIMNRTNTSLTTFVGVNSKIDNVAAIFNLPTGINQAVSISTSFLEFISSNPSVASVDSTGLVTSLSAGTAVITAKFGDTVANGSLTINCVGTFVHAPTPTKTAANVISIFSNPYTNVPVNYYNGYWAPWQTTVSNDFTVNGDGVLNYTKFNFVGIEFSSPTINATAMTHVHLDAFFPTSIASGRQLRVIVVDFGADGAFNGGDDTRYSTTFTAPTLVSNKWVSIDIPFASMPTLLSRAHLAQIILEGGDNSVLYVDNIYFYK